MKAVNSFIASFIVFVLGVWCFNIVHPWLGIGIIFGLLYFYVYKFANLMKKESE